MQAANGMRQIMHGLQWDLIDPGLIIEHKAYSICVHYRLARDREKAAREVEAALPQLDPAPLVIGGKCGINLLPAGAGAFAHARRKADGILYWRRRDR